jgi:hypothetical protein
LARRGQPAALEFWRSPGGPARKSQPGFEAVESVQFLLPERIRVVFPIYIDARINPVFRDDHGKRCIDGIELNEKARVQMRCEVKIDTVPGETHLFEEPGALERVADLASDWFLLHAVGSAGPH